MKQLLVNADDFGLCRGVTDGIFEAHQQGIVTSTSLMATAEAFDHAVTLARSAPRLGVGVHLTLVEERPISNPADIPTLVQPNGKLPASYSSLLTGILLRRIRLSHVEQELRAQIEKCAATGLQLTHLDSHQHVHALPALFQMVLRMARDYRIPGVRIPRDSPRWRGARDGLQLQKTALCWLARRDARVYSLQGLAACDQMVGLFDSGSLTEDRLLRIIELLPDGTTELVSHPGRPDADSARYGHWEYNWSGELQALTSGRVREALREQDVQLIGYKDLVR